MNTFQKLKAIVSYYLSKLNITKMKTNNFKNLAMGLVLALMAVGLFAMTQKASKEVAVKEVSKVEEVNKVEKATKEVSKAAVVMTCFEFIGGSSPTIGEVLDPANYLDNPLATCPGLAEILCRVCFDENFFPLNDDDQPDFENEDNLQLKLIVEANWNNTSKDGVPIDVPGAPGQTVTLHFKPIS